MVQKEKILSQIIVGVILALLVGSTSPWWWKFIFKPESSVSNPDSTVTITNPPKRGGQISVSVNNNPRVIPPGGRTEISVLAQTSDGSVISDAKVVLAAGGGVFEETGNTKSIGMTNSQGVYRTIWKTYEPSVYSGDMQYLINADVAKEGFTNGTGETTIFIKK